MEFAMHGQRDAQGSVSPLRVWINGDSRPRLDFGSVFGPSQNGFCGTWPERCARFRFPPLRVWISGVSPPGPDFGSVFGPFEKWTLKFTAGMADIIISVSVYKLFLKTAHSSRHSSNMHFQSLTRASFTRQTSFFPTPKSRVSDFLKNVYGFRQ